MHLQIFKGANLKKMFKIRTRAVHFRNDGGNAFRDQHTQDKKEWKGLERGEGGEKNRACEGKEEGRMHATRLELE